MYEVCWFSFKNCGNERLESLNVLDVRLLDVEIQTIIGGLGRKNSLNVAFRSPQCAFAL